MVNRKRKAAAVSDSPAKRQAIIRKASKRVTTNDGQSQGIEEDSHPAEHFKKPSNPQATLEGLPVELRLQIYNYLCDSTIIHVHDHYDEKANTSKFTWTPCRAPNPKSPLLCANPKWSGMCDEADRCTYKLYAPPEPRGFWALAASSKYIRNETQEFFLRSTVVSMDPRTLRPWLDHLEKHAPKQLNSIRRITLAGPTVHAYSFQTGIPDLQRRAPNLEAVGIQVQDASYRWMRSTVNNKVQIPDNAWSRVHWIHWMYPLQPTIDVAIEALIWRKHYRGMLSSVPEQQAAIRIYRKGRTVEEGGRPAASPWQDSDVEVETDSPGKVHSYKRNAKWRQWWRTKEAKSLV
ncbi:hypothetical protein IQ07DRAFT_586153 [Pyrenochaeta sp. DS3sAY3a]|nr:hypothetical protein IQ07DRAFT_586153 [Pyrenochaeta sp. DS3sAY3a]